MTSGLMPAWACVRAALVFLLGLRGLYYNCMPVIARQLALLDLSAVCECIPYRWYKRFSPSVQ